MKDKRNTRRGGFYWRDGKPYVSVTTVLKIIDKPALRYWFGKEVYLAMVQDPTLSQKEALSAPYKTSKKAMGRGTTVHSIVEAWKQSKTMIDTVPEPFKGYAEAFYDFVKNNHIEILENERSVVNEKEQYAGTLDLIVKMNGGPKLIVDVKTGKGIYPEAFLQLSAYKHALGEDYDIAVLLLGENGKYQFAKGEDCYEQFLAAKKLWEWNNKEMLQKVGYYQLKI